MVVKVVLIALASIFIGVPLYLLMGKFFWGALKFVMILFDGYPSFPKKPDAVLKSLWLVLVLLFIVVATIGLLVIVLYSIWKIWLGILKWCWRVESRV